MSNNRLSLARDILLAIAISGGVLTIALVAPGILQIFGSLVKKYGRDNFYPSRVKTRFDSFRSRGLVTISERGGETTIRLTKAGKKMALSYQVDEMEIKPQKHWDGKWRIVFFDIPEKKASARNVFRDKLKELGFKVRFFYVSRRAKTVVKFSLVGLIATAVDFFFYKIFIISLGLPPATSKGLSTEVAIINSFIY